MADNTEEISEDDELLAAFVDESLELLQDLLVLLTHLLQELFL